MRAGRGLESVSRASASACGALLGLTLLASTGCGGGGGGGGSQASGAVVSVADPGPQVVSEEQDLRLPLQVTGADGAAGRVSVQGLPPGARFDEVSRTISFRPDFIQGGRSYVVSVTATDGVETAQRSFRLRVQDTIAPPWPSIQAVTDGGDHERVELRQTTDVFLDSPGYSGRSFTARIVVPKAATPLARLPVRVYLHGFGGSPWTGGRTGEFAIYAHDSMNSYWWGYGESLPRSAPASGRVPNYTQRRVLHLLEWVLRTYPGADPERVYVVGGSMGGAGALTLGLLYARHFSHIYATIGQTVPRNHRPSRLTQLEALWGTRAANLHDGAGMGVWDRMDLTRALRDSAEAREQFVFTKHGKDDPTIHFGAVTQASALTAISFYDALVQERVGHYVVWDEGGHGSSDPVLGGGWWDDGWSLVFDPVTSPRRGQAFPAFTRSSHDEDPGTGGGNGTRPFDPSSGYAGAVSTPGDTGWDGAIAGCRNRYLRWRSAGIVDTVDRLEMPLGLAAGNGAAAPRTGYPTVGDRLGQPAPITCDVTVRRTQRFRPRPWMRVRWSFGARSGTAGVGADGEVTVPGLAVQPGWTTLVLER